MQLFEVLFDVGLHNGFVSILIHTALVLIKLKFIHKKAS